MDIRVIQQNEIEQMKTLRDYCFSRLYTGNKLTDYLNWAKNSTSVGAFDGEKLVGQTIALPIKQQLYHQQMAVAGVGYVGVYPEYRSLGLMKKIIQESLVQMRQDKQYLSVLGPFSVSYYRKMGWEIMFDSVNYTCDMRDFPQVTLEKIPIFKRYSFDDWPEKEVKIFYNTLASQRNGMMLRDDFFWERLFLREADSYFVLTEKAFMRYRKNGLSFKIEDFLCVDQQGMKELLFFINMHRSNFFTVEGVTSPHHPLHYYLTSFPCKREMGSQFMGRIVDVVKAFELLTFDTTSRTIYLNVEDPLCPWNNGYFEIKGKIITKIEKQPPINSDIIKLSIGALSALFFGYHSIEELKTLELADGPEEMINFFSRTFVFQKAEMFDHF